MIILRVRETATRFAALIVGRRDQFRSDLAHDFGRAERKEAVRVARSFIGSIRKLMAKLDSL